MNLQTGDYIIIRDWDKTNFFRNKYYKGLENKPTRVWIWGDGRIFVAHPDLDLVELHDDIVYDKIIDVDDLPDHKEYKKKVKEFGKISSNQEMPNEKPLLKFLRKKNIKEEEEPEKKLSPSDLKILNMIDKINDGEIEIGTIEKLFGSLSDFISFITKKGFLNELDPFKREFEDYQNLLFYNFVQSDPNFVYTIATNLMNGITKIGEDYYYDADYSELTNLFRTNRNAISEESIEKILSGEYDPYDYGGYDADNEYRDVYDNLDHYTKSVVDEFIVNELKSMEVLDFSIYRAPESLRDIAEEQDSEDKIKLTDEVITRLMSDNDCIEYLINEKLDEVRSNLNMIYSSCYGDALVDNWYNSLWGALEGDVVDSRQGEDYQYQKSVWLKDGTRGTKTSYGKRFKVTKCLFNLIKGWLEENKNNSSFGGNTIEYFGSYINLMQDSMEHGPMDFIRVPRLDDYPDYRKMNKCINDNVESYF